MEEKIKNLTPRQWDLYNFLKSQYADGVYISKAQICEALPEHYEIKQNETRACRDIEFDVRIINSNEIIQKVIVSSQKGYKIGNEAECELYLKTRIKREVQSFRLTKMLKKKLKKNNQMRLTFGTSERDVIEAYPR